MMSKLENHRDSFLAKSYLIINWKLIKQKLLAQGFKAEECSLAIFLYSMFLFVSYQYPQEKLVPNKYIDLVLHSHLEDKKQFRKDLKSLGISSRTHLPKSGFMNEKDRQEWLASFEHTKDLFEDIFGEDSMKDASPVPCEWIPETA